MSLAVSVLRNSPASNPDKILTKVTASGNYATGGDAVNLTPSSWTDPNGEGIIGPNFLGTIPPTFDVSNAGGYYCQYVPGTTLTNGLLIWYAPGGAQLAAGAYPAAILNAFILMTIFTRGA